MANIEFEHGITKDDLISMAKGCEPHHSIMENPLIKKHGTYSGGFNDEWNWNYGTFDNLSGKEIYEIYRMCKDSWK